jgi:hypothetical protein
MRNPRNSNASLVCTILAWLATVAGPPTAGRRGCSRTGRRPRRWAAPGQVSAQRLTPAVRRGGRVHEELPAGPGRLRVFRWPVDAYSSQHLHWHDPRYYLVPRRAAAKSPDKISVQTRRTATRRRAPTSKPGDDYRSQTSRRTEDFCPVSTGPETATTSPWSTGTGSSWPGAGSAARGLAELPN